ncbi:KdsC family phosphatase [Croceimicrobium sp.]|uniref:KdsC family phosphatase n=1 Tax=Croceimicrobium sp. TaxID=2828340 RepID=UPI003BAABAFB
MTDHWDNLRANLHYLQRTIPPTHRLYSTIERFSRGANLEVFDLFRIAEETGYPAEVLFKKRIDQRPKRVKMLVMDCDGVMTKGEMIVSTDGEHTKIFNVKDGMGIKQAQEAGILTGIISHGHSTGVVESRAKQLGIPLVYVGKTPKLEVIQSWWKEHNISPEDTAYIGDDINDIPILETVGAAFAPADAVEDVLLHPEIHILSRKGGEACIRELVDQHLLI